MKNYTINKTILLFKLYKIEDKTQYRNKELSKYIDKLQNKKNLKGEK